jgi:polar amino acid transport system substrate-binding protein
LEKRLLAFLLTTLLLFADTASAQEPPPFRWGTDPTGGAPFIYQDKNGNYTGFEYDLARYIAKKLGRKSQMVVGDWANLPQQLKKPADAVGGIDVVFNGYELREDLCNDYAPSRAYYAFRLALMMRKDNPDIKGWDDLNDKDIGVLGGTAAHTYLIKNHSDSNIKSNPDVANVIKLVNDKRMDATVQDGPPAVHFCKEQPTLTYVPAPGKPGYYVIYYRKTDVELGQKIDAIIGEALKDGTIKAILDNYGLWNDEQKDLIDLLNQPWPPSFDEPNEEETDSPWPRLTRVVSDCHADRDRRCHVTRLWAEVGAILLHPVRRSASWYAVVAANFLHLLHDP